MLLSKHMSAATISLFLAIVALALITGLWYAYSCSVNWGLGKLPDKEYLSAMQSINREILNPLFFATFMGTLLLLPISTWLNYHTPSPRFLLLVIASLLYAIGVFGVTMACNVPLNNGLDALDLNTALPEELQHYRSAFEQPWNRWHTVRTWASFAAFVLVVIACMTPSTEE